MGRTLIKVVAVLLVALLVAVGLAWIAVRRMLAPEAVRAALEQQATAALGQPVRIGAADLALSLRPRIVLSDVRIGSAAPLVIDRVSAATGLRALLSRRIEEADFAIAGSRVHLPLPFALPTGGDSSPVTPSATPGAAITVVSVDRIVLEAIDLVVGQQRLRLDVESSLHGDRLDVARIRLASALTTIDGRGAVESLARRQARFAFEADALDLDELLAIASGVAAAPGTDPRLGGAGAPPPASSPGAMPPLDARIEIRAARGRALGIPFAPLAATLAITRDGVTLDPASLGVFGGTIAGRVSLSSGVGEQDLALAADLKGLDVAALTAQAGVGGVMTGRLDGRADLGARAGDPAVVFRTAGGRATLVVRDGTIPGLDLVGPAIRAFGPSGPASASSAGSRRFSSLRGTFTLADGVLRTSDLSMQSPDVDLKGRGALRVAGAVVDMSATLILSEALSAQAGRDLYRYAREGNRIVLPATVRGPLASPRVGIDVGNAASRALRNAAEDELKKGLDRLFKRPD